MVRTVLSAVLIFAVAALAAPAPSPQLPDPAQAKNVGNGAGRQFIGGQCLSSADCAAQACCATLRRPGSGDIGVCSGLLAADQQGKVGCGFGDGGASPPLSPSPGNGDGSVDGDGDGDGDGAAVVDPNLGTGDGRQFITGPCAADADCASGCCSPNAGAAAARAGTCAARAVATEPAGRGCGFLAA